MGDEKWTFVHFEIKLVRKIIFEVNDVFHYYRLKPMDSGLSLRKDDNPTLRPPRSARRGLDAPLYAVGRGWGRGLSESPRIKKI